MAASNQTFFPISELSPYHSKWTIKARVTDKGILRTFNQSSKGREGGGKVFHVVLLDSSEAEIRASFFNDAADKYHDLIQKGECYTFTRGSLRVANKQWNNTSHRYELIFDRDAVVEKSADDTSIQVIKYSFVPFRALQTKSLPCVVDLCGVITSFLPTMTVRTKDGQEITKREVILADDTATSICVTLWGERAMQEDKVFEGHPAIAVKSVALKEFRESRNGSLLQGGSLVFNPPLPEADRVRQWWAQGGSTQSLSELSKQEGGGDSRANNAKPTSLAGLREAAERLTSQPEIFSVVSRLALVQTRKQGEVHPLQYMACQEPNERGFPCNRRIDEQGFCAACNRVGKSAPRLNVRCRFVDAEDQTWLTCFHEAAGKVLGMSAEEVKKMEAVASEKGEAGREELDACIRNCYFGRPLALTIRGKMQVYNGESRADWGVIGARPVSYGDHGRQMLKEIRMNLMQGSQAGA